MTEKVFRKIGIFTDSHGLLEPTKAALEDMTRRGITEIYSLGDNIGRGPNPSEVMDLLEEYGVISIAGNAEEYVNLGIEPFSSCFDIVKEKSQLWTLSKLNEHQKGIISLYPHSIELLLGGKKLALCHFANDVRFDFKINNALNYKTATDFKLPAYMQFLYTNSPFQFKKMQKVIKKYGEDSPMVRGYISALKDPLFALKKVDFFDAVIEGHVHWKIYEKSNKTEFYTIRAVGMAYNKDPIDTASYCILAETENGYNLEEVLVKYDREKMEYSILNSDIPDEQIYKFVELRKGR